MGFEPDLNCSLKQKLSVFLREAGDRQSSVKFLIFPGRFWALFFL